VLLALSISIVAVTNLSKAVKRKKPLTWHFRIDENYTEAKILKQNTNKIWREGKQLEAEINRLNKAANKHKHKQTGQLGLGKKRLNYKKRATIRLRTTSVISRTASGRMDSLVSGVKIKMHKERKGYAYLRYRWRLIHILREIWY
jgi:hypothetical protein